jgi:mono/diheme cytochrome c family protein
LSRNDQQAAGSVQLAEERSGSLPAARCPLPAVFCRLPAVFCLLLAACCLLFVVGCRQQMAETGREKPLDASTVFDDQRVARPLVPGTVARGQLKADAVFYTGKGRDGLVDQLPVPLTKDLLARGRDRFEIFCAPCHGRVGTGDGAVAKRGMRPPPSYHIQRLKEAPVGHFFDVITNGFGIMPEYAGQVPPADRWAIAAYIRVLQVSQGIPAAELTPDERAKLDAPTGKK